MNRRSFLETTVSALVLPSLAQAVPATPVVSAAPAAAATNSTVALSSKTVSFLSDISPISPQERIAELQRMASSAPEISDRYLGGGVVDALEERVARLLGKEDAVFMTTGTMANNVAVRLLCGERRHALVQADSTLYLAEGDSAQMLSGLNLVPLAPGGR